MKKTNKRLGAALAASLLIAGLAPNANAEGLDRLSRVANAVSVSQQGQGNAGAITQNGTGNQAGLQQIGRNNTGTINQNGSNNTACLVQLGRNLDGSIVQNGDNQSTGMLQTRRGTREIPPEICTVQSGGRHGLWRSSLAHLARGLH